MPRMVAEVLGRTLMDKQSTPISNQSLVIFHY